MVQVEYCVGKVLEHLENGVTFALSDHFHFLISSFSDFVILSFCHFGQSANSPVCFLLTETMRATNAAKDGRARLRKFLARYQPPLRSPFGIQTQFVLLRQPLHCYEPPNQICALIASAPFPPFFPSISSHHAPHNVGKLEESRTVVQPHHEPEQTGRIQAVVIASPQQQ